MITNEDNMALMARYPDKYFDLAIVDPEYGIKVNANIGRRKGDIKKHKKVKWDSKPPDKKYFDELFRVSKKQIIWGANNFSFLPPSNGWIVWDKDISGDVDFSECELAFCNVKNTVKKFKYRAQSNENYKVKIHPTQKPVALYKWILDKYAQPNDKILDTHLGSMSIAIACHDYGFDLTGCELDKEYFDAGMKRLENHKKQLNIFL
jgi:site-specific DNA-methyltransferase (adenine-specific)